MFYYLTDYFLKINILYLQYCQLQILVNLIIVYYLQLQSEQFPKMLIGLLMKKIARSPSQSASLTLKTMGLFSDIYSRDQNDEEIINAKISELKITTLSEAAQKSLWAAVFINRIMRDPPTFEQLQKQPLRQQLLNLKLNLNLQLDPAIQKEMKSYFALDGGVVVSKDIYTQERFGTAEKIKKTKSKVKSRFVFHPTYTTTGHMFRCVFDRLGWRRMLLFGKWGIGKSLAIVLATMLSNHISEFHYNNADTPQAVLITQYLQQIPPKIVYWSMNDSQTEQKLLQIILPQIKNQLQLDIEEAINRKLEKKKKLNSKEKKKILQIIIDLKSYYKHNNNDVVLIIDQINKLASLRRQHRKILFGKSTQKQQPLILEKSQRLNKLKNIMQFSGDYTLYNSSSNIEQSLISLDSDSQGLLRLGDGHKKHYTKSFDYQKRISFEEGNIGFLQLSQYFSSVLQQMISFSPSVQKQWEDQDVKNQKTINTTRRQFFRQVATLFRQTKWIFPANALIIRQKIFLTQERFKNCSSAQSLREQVCNFLKGLNNNARVQAKIRMKKFVRKDIIGKSEQSSQDVTKKDKLKFYLSFINVLVGIIKNGGEKTENSTFFQIKSQQHQHLFKNISLDALDKELFNIQHTDDQIKIIKCFINPKQLRDILIIITIQVISQLQQKDRIQILSTMGKKKLGYYFQEYFLQALLNCNNEFTYKSLMLDPQVKTTSLTPNKTPVYIPNFKIDKQNRASIQKNIDSNLKGQSENLYLCLPNQFKQKTTKNRENNDGFDFLIVKRRPQQPKLKYYFFDLTISDDIGSKIRQILNLMANIQQFKPCFDYIRAQVSSLQQRRQQRKINKQQNQFYIQVNSISFSNEHTQNYKHSIILSVINFSGDNGQIKSPKQFLKTNSIQNTNLQNLDKLSVEQKQRYLKQQNLFLSYQVLIRILDIKFYHINSEHELLKQFNTQNQTKGNKILECIPKAKRKIEQEEKKKAQQIAKQKAQQQKAQQIAPHKAQ